MYFIKYVVQQFFLFIILLNITSTPKAIVYTYMWKLNNIWVSLLKAIAVVQGYNQVSEKFGKNACSYGILLLK